MEDLGSAHGKVAVDLNVDNSIMPSVGAATMKIGLVEGTDVEGVHISIKGNNICFDRKP